MRKPMTMKLMTMKPMKTRHSGFTLVEILVSMLIFAILFAVAFRGLNALAYTRTHLEETEKTWSDAFTFFSRLDAQVMNRMDPGTANASVLPGFQWSFKIVRSGQIQLVGYRLKDGKVEMGLADADGGNPQVYTQLSGIKELTVRTMDQNGQWITYGPGNADFANVIDAPLFSDAPPVPIYLDVAITLSTGESLHREWPM